jgi:isopentenyldiphosphate isomerase/intracellular septation protein A
MNKKTLLKNFSIGFIPLFIFIIADEIFDTQTALIIAVFVGISEFLYYYIRFKQIEKFVLFDTALIITLGGISILLENDIFFKLKPALIEFIIVILLGIHSFSNKPLLLMMGKRYLKDMDINDFQLKQMQKLTKLLFYIFLVHVSLIIYSAYYLSNEAWAFISGGLFYIIFVLIFTFQWFYMKYFNKPIPKFDLTSEKEIFDLVTPEGKIIGQAPRSEVHGNPGLLHPVVHIHVFNKNGQLFLQKRAKNKEVQPNKWDTSIGGHVHTGETVENALSREAFEELGLKNSHFQPLYRYVMNNNFESELVYTFKTKHNGPFKINKDEISYGRFWKVKEIKNNLGKGIFTPNFEQEFKLLENIINKSRK